MAILTQIHHPDFSLWQSAVEQTAAKAEGLAAAAVRNAGHPMIGATDTLAENLKNGISPAQVAQTATPKDAASWAKYCSSIWWEIAKAQVAGDKEAEQKWRACLGPFTTCDDRYAEAAAAYVAFQLKKDQIPYKVWQDPSDFIIDWEIPSKARIAILGDWGTGQTDARALLETIARKNPDIVIHLGDIYYAGTEFEMQNYFWDIWTSIFDLSKVRTFTLAGNHDMYSGGAPYYELLGRLNQPASYFCLRNLNWQFVALDTGLHDDDALDAKPTYLEDTEVAWLQDKISSAAGRRTVLLSHHQLFTANEDIGGQSVNVRLQQQVGSMLPHVDVWFWGHEHNQVIYRPWQGVLARCLGHGAYPVGITEIPPKPRFEVPMQNVTLTKGTAFYSHGYAIMDLDGPAARVGYYQDSDPEDSPMFMESFGAAAVAQ
ncbi:MAG TPA: metallophosphoesterase [Bryobacteraceae bacterium]|nr:metallophosphoesterase [Bryobacteraceae bacterium]